MVGKVSERVLLREGECLIHDLNSLILRNHDADNGLVMGSRT